MKMKALSKNTKSNLITYGMVILAYVVMEICKRALAMRLLPLQDIISFIISL